ncbi:MAG: DNA/RNA non-specific endonuclease [Pyrinomonadaceae bacterium]
MRKYFCAPKRVSAQRTLAATSLLALLSTLFLFTPAWSKAPANSPRQFNHGQRSNASVLASTSLVISQFQVAGGTAADEFIELHNVSSSAIDLNGNRLVYRSAAGTADVAVVSWTTSTIIPAGGYYLVASSVGYDGTTAGDITFSSGSTGAFAAAGGGFALRNGAANTGTIIDAVGYGTATNAFVETTVTTAPAANAGKERGNSGCTDSDNNSTDFILLDPSAPRNGATAVNICSGGGGGGIPALSINNVTLTEGDSGTKTFSFTVSLSAPAGANGVTFDIATADGTATVSGNDYVSKTLTGQTIAAGLQSYTFDVTVNGDLAIEPTETFAVNVTNVTGATVADGVGAGTITTDDISNAPTATGSANPSTVQAGDPVLLTVTVTPGTNPVSTVITVTGNLTAIGGSSAQTFYDDGITGGDETAGDNVFSFQGVVAAGTTNGAKSILVTVTDAQSRTGNTTIALTVGATGTGHNSAEHLVMGNPSGATTDVNNPFNYLLLKQQYAMSYHRDRGIPNWVSWHLDSTWLGSAPRQNDFRPDTTLPAGWYQVMPSSYSGSGFDRGHHTPSGDRTSNIPDNSATFLMTNMMPQAPGNNQGPWEKLESYSRTLVGEGNELYIIGGGVGTGGTGDAGYAETIDSGRVTVPAQTWKVIVILPVGDNDVARVINTTRTIGVIMPNNTVIRPDQWQKYIATVDQVEALTGYDFFSNVDPLIQAQIESKLDALNNTAPTAAPQSKTTTEDAATAVTLSATDPNVNNVLTYAVVSGPANGTLSGSGANLTYTPNADYFGTDSFTYKANDSTFDSSVVTITINVSEVNDAPIAAVDSKATGRNAALTFAAADLTANDNPGAVNESNQTLSVTQVIATTQTHGTVTLSNGQITFTPEADYTGAATFDYQVCDNGTTNGVADVKCSVSTVNVTVTAPTAASVSVSGRVTGTTGRGIKNVSITMMDATGVSRQAQTNSFGYYQFETIEAGETIVLTAKAKRYSFRQATIVKTVYEQIDDADFVAAPMR